MDSIIKYVLTTVEKLDGIVTEYYPTVEEKKRNALVKELWEILWNDYSIIDVIPTVEEFELENKTSDDGNAYEILDDFIDILAENKINSKRLLNLLIFDMEWYRAFKTLISWDRRLLTKNEFDTLVDVGKSFGYRWDGERWIDEDGE